MATTSQQKVSAAINTAILSSIGTDVGNRVYDTKVPDNKTLPYCRYQIIFDENINDLSCSRQEVTLQVNFFGNGKFGVKALRSVSDDLFSDLQRSQLSIADIAISNVINGTLQGISTIEEDGDIINIRQQYIINIQ